MVKFSYYKTSYYNLLEKCMLSVSVSSCVYWRLHKNVKDKKEPQHDAKIPNIQSVYKFQYFKSPRRAVYKE